MDLLNNTLFQAIASGIVGALVGVLFTVWLTRGQARDAEQQRDLLKQQVEMANRQSQDTKRQITVLESQLNMLQLQRIESNIEPLINVISHILVRYHLDRPPSGDEIRRMENEWTLFIKQRELGATRAEGLDEVRHVVYEYLECLTQYSRGMKSREEVERLRNQSVQRINAILDASRRPIQYLQ